MSTVIDKGRPDLDDSPSTTMEDLGTQQIANICALEQACRLYQPNNAVVQKILLEIHQTSIKFSAATGEEMRLALIGPNVFINSRLIHMSFNAYQKAHQLKELWNRMGINLIIFPTDLLETGVLEFINNFYAFFSVPGEKQPLDQQIWGGIRFQHLNEDDVLNAQRPDPEELATRVFSILTLLTRTMLSQIQDGKPPPMLRIRRALQILIDLTNEKRDLLLSFVISSSRQKDLISHLVNTTIFSIILGQRLLMSRKQLINLATAALFHDFPKAWFKYETFSTPGWEETLGSTERARAHHHWLSSLSQMIELGNLNDEMLSRLVVIYESQLEFSREDLYPGQEETLEKQLSVFSRIITICSFLAATYQLRANDNGIPWGVMLEIIKEAGKRFDLSTVQLVIKSIGLYPTGSLVLLNTNEIGVVIAQNENEPDKPAVKILLTDKGRAKEGINIDLALEPSREVYL